MAHNIYNMSDRRYLELKKAISNDKKIQSLIEETMRLTGKKETEVRELVSNAFIQIEMETGSLAMEVFEKAMENTSPIIGAESDDKKERAKGFALRWIIKDSIEERFDVRLSKNIIEAANNNGRIVKKKNSILEKAGKKKGGQ